MNSLIYDNDMSINVIDDSLGSESYTDVLDDTLAFLFPVFTSRGRANKIIEFKNPGDAKDEYGDDFDDFDKYGQANVCAIGALKGKARAFLCKLLPSDAVVANIMIGVAVSKQTGIIQYQREDTVVTNGVLTTLGTGSYVYDSTGSKIPIQVTSTTDPATTMNLLLDGYQIKVIKKEITTFDADGTPSFDGSPYDEIDAAKVSWKVYPLFMANYYSAGVGGNNFGFTIQKNTSRNRQVDDGCRYVMTLFEYLESGEVQEVLNEPIYFSFNPDALYQELSTTREGLEYVYSNSDDLGNLSKIQINSFSSNFKTLVELLYPYVNTGTSDDVDFIFGTDEEEQNYGRVVLNDETIDVENTTIMLLGGSDGSLGLGNTVTKTVNGTSTTSVVTAASILETRKTLLLNFFNCDVDNLIFDEKLCDVDIISDANYPTVVKEKILSSIPKYRPDIFLAIDCGITKSYKEALTAINELSTYVNTDASYMVMINGHSGYTNSSSGLSTPKHVTYTFDWVKRIAEVYNTSPFQMIAGVTNGKTKYVKWDWLAEKSKVNMFLKLEKAKCNYICKVNKQGDTMYGYETTMYNANISKLTSVRNALIIGDAQRVCHKVLIKYKYDPRNIDATISAATTEMTDVLRGRYPDTINVTVKIYQTTQDQLSDNAHCDIIFKFPNYIKKFSVTITAKRQDASSASTSS